MRPSTSPERQNASPLGRLLRRAALLLTLTGAAAAPANAQSVSANASNPTACRKALDPCDGKPGRVAIIQCKRAAMATAACKPKSDNSERAAQEKAEKEAARKVREAERVAQEAREPDATDLTTAYDRDASSTATEATAVVQQDTGSPVEAIPAVLPENHAPEVPAVTYIPPSGAVVVTCIPTACRPGDLIVRTGQNLACNTPETPDFIERYRDYILALLALVAGIALGRLTKRRRSGATPPQAVVAGRSNPPSGTDAPESDPGSDGSGRPDVILPGGLLDDRDDEGRESDDLSGGENYAPEEVWAGQLPEVLVARDIDPFANDGDLPPLDQQPATGSFKPIAIPNPASDSAKNVELPAPANLGGDVEPPAPAVASSDGTSDEPDDDDSFPPLD